MRNRKVAPAQSVTVAEHLNSSMSLVEAERLGVLERTFTSQFDVLSDSEYGAGMRGIRAAAGLLQTSCSPSLASHSSSCCASYFALQCMA
jgi:hypothetical protein